MEKWAKKPTVVSPDVVHCDVVMFQIFLLYDAVSTIHVKGMKKIILIDLEAASRYNIFLFSFLENLSIILNNFSPKNVFSLRILFLTTASNIASIFTSGRCLKLSLNHFSFSCVWCVWRAIGYDNFMKFVYFLLSFHLHENTFEPKNFGTGR